MRQADKEVVRTARNPRKHRKGEWPTRLVRRRQALCRRTQRNRAQKTDVHCGGLECFYRKQNRNRQACGQKGAEENQGEGEILGATMNEKSLILYHGTDAKITTPDLTKCKTFRDFGKASTTSTAPSTPSTTTTLPADAGNEDTSVETEN